MTVKKIKIFLASSGELKDEREKFELFISRENKKYINDNIFLELIVWEDLKASFNGERMQDYFNNELLKCKIVIVLFGTKVGQFTEEEFDIAYKAFKVGENPKYLYIYFKDINISINDITTETLKINGLKEKIQKLEQVYNSYNSIDNLILQLKLQLDKIIPEIKKIKNEDTNSRFRTSSLLLKHRQDIKSKFEKLISHNKKYKLRKEIIIRDIARLEEYPEYSKKEDNNCPSSWFKVGIAGLYYNGIKIVIPSFATYLVKIGDKYKKKEYKSNEDYIITHLIAEISFEDIDSLDLSGDENTSFPQVFCSFNHEYKKCFYPYNKVYYGQPIKSPNDSTYYNEICKIDDVLD